VLWLLLRLAGGSKKKVHKYRTKLNVHAGQTIGSRGQFNPIQRSGQRKLSRIGHIEECRRFRGPLNRNGVFSGKGLKTFLSLRKK